MATATRSAVLLFSIFSLMMLSLPQPALAQLAAHRAVYDISMRESAERSGINGVHGRMVIELTGSTCDGWNVTFRMINQYLLRKGRSRLADNRSSSWESGDGSKLRYTQRQYIDNRLEEETLLKIDRNDSSNSLVGRMTKPSEQKFDLPAEAIFPAQHQLRLLNAAVEGNSRDRSIVYDGSEGAKAYVAVSFIGKQLTGLQQAGEGAESLAEMKVWPVSISYFSISDEAKEELPIYQVQFRMFENGVAGDLVLDYGDFVLDGKMSVYETITSEPCG